MTGSPAPLDFLPVAQRERLLAIGLEVTFPAGARLSDEGGEANWCWLLRTGEVALDVCVPGRHPAAVVETPGPGRLLGWSWAFPPFRWQRGARAKTLVVATEFPVADVLQRCTTDPGSVMP
ncbi:MULTISPECIES: cyclic nucleotide-binding domain-containing protein [Streptomyces]|uniref:cyclic nucleotide-binding domain-containing protein n=1 Tax=Streptomyces TaxID=1883 RepID=UPI000AB6AC91|nr:MULTISPECIES: cyclic nucleotide-binding domain-containing protein [Streptomyces]